MLALLSLLACIAAKDTKPGLVQASAIPFIGVGAAQVPPSGPYGERTFDVPGDAYWVNTGVFLRAGETLEFSASGTWNLDGQALSAEGDAELGEERGCALGALALRSGQTFEGPVACLGSAGTFTSETDAIVYAGMVVSNDVGDIGGARLRADGALQLTLISQADTVPTVSIATVQDYPFEQVSSGWVELQSAHNVVTVPAAQVVLDLATAQAAMDTLDAMYQVEKELRGAAPFKGERIRWIPDASIESFSYMLASNPVRGVPDLFTGGDNQRILRSAEPETDIWGFAHEMGHCFSFVNGTWTYQYGNMEGWPNLFTLRVLEQLDRIEHQHSYETYCDGKPAYLQGGTYEDLADPSLHLCFLKDFEAEYGESFYDDFFRGMNSQINEDLPWDGTHATVWAYVKGRFDLAAGQDTSAVFERWGVPVE